MEPPLLRIEHHPTTKKTLQGNGGIGL